MSEPIARQTSGTFNIWIDRTENLEEGVRCRWGSFEILGENCCVISEGRTLGGIIRGGSGRPIRLFDIPFALDQSRRHLVTFGWKRGRLKVFLDAKLLGEFALSIPA